MQVMKRNAVILAAGTSSRFVPLSAEIPKGLLEVKGEVLIERQIRQLREAGIDDITIVAGYKAEMFGYLRDRFNVDIVVNEDYRRYNNTSSLIRVLDRLGDTYICSSDNYFPHNVFKGEPGMSYYSALYAEGDTKEYCLDVDADDMITGVRVGGHDAWYMVGHVYFSKEFSERFIPILRQEYENADIRRSYWEDVYIKHIEELPGMQVRRYEAHDIEEFDTLDELRAFDAEYLRNTRSAIVADIARRLGCGEEEVDGFCNIPHDGDHLLFTFRKDGAAYRYDGSSSDKITGPDIITAL